jgi:hypothetical protein
MLKIKKKSANFILGTNTKSTNLRIHEIVIFNQTMKIYTHEEKYFHSISGHVVKGSGMLDGLNLNIMNTSVNDM